MLQSLNSKYDLKKAIADFPIRRWVSERLGVTPVGDSCRCDCPHCGYKSAMRISFTSKRIKCYACDDGGHGGTVWNGRGGLLDLIMLVDRVQMSDAVSTVFAYSEYPEQTIQARAVVVPENIIPSNALPLSKALVDHPARVQLSRRRLDHLLPRLYLCVDGHYAGRWVIPCRYFGQLEGVEYKTYEGAKPKSLFPHRWFQTDKCIYTTYGWDESKDFAIITESAFDAETLRTNAVGLYGSVLHEGQLDRLFDLQEHHGVHRLVWCLDPDAWAKQSRAILSRTRTFFENYVCTIPEGDDPNSLGYQVCWDLVRNAQYIGSSLDLLRLVPENRLQ